MPSDRLWGAAVPGPDPETWAHDLAQAGFRAAVWPEDAQAGWTAYRDAAAREGLVWAEVGAWSNPLADDEDERRAALQRCVERLDLAEQLGARCCVNIAGSRAAAWDGPHPANVSPGTFDQIVETVRTVIDRVKPRRTAYTLEMMPWVWPWDVEGYRALLKAVDRPAFGVHVDVVNILTSPVALWRSTEVIRDVFTTLGPWIRSCHVKDAALQPGFPSHVQETAALWGSVDLAELLRQADTLSPAAPLILEHQATWDEYRATADRLRAAGLW